MFTRIHFHHPHYFSRTISKDLRELFISVSMLEGAIAMVALFEPVYLFTLGFSVPEILLYFGALYALYVLLVPIGGRIVAHIGVRRGIVFASVSLIGYYLSLFAIAHAFWFVVPAILFYAVQKSLYWPAYHKDFVETSDTVNQGREISFIRSLVLAVNVAGPVIGGFVLAYASFSALFFVVIGLIIASNIPLFLTTTTLPRERFSIRRSWTMLVDSAHRRFTFAYIGFGEELVEFTIWPLFMFLILESTAGMGVYLGAGTFISSVLLLFVGKMTDRRKNQTHTFLTFGASLLSFSWLSRILIFSPIPLFIAHFAGNTVKSFSFVTLTTLSYEQARKEHPLAFGVLFEQSLAFGKAAIAFLLAGVFSFFGFFGVFLAAAAFSLLYAAFPRPR